MRRQMKNLFMFCKLEQNAHQVHAEKILDTGIVMDLRGLQDDQFYFLMLRSDKTLSEDVFKHVSMLFPFQAELEDCVYYPDFKWSLKVKTSSVFHQTLSMSIAKVRTADYCMPSCGGGGPENLNTTTK